MIDNKIRTVPRFVGRDQYVRWFVQRLQNVHKQQPQIVLLAGEPGIGKTRLLNHIQSLADCRHMRVYHYRYDTELALPYLPWVHHLLHHCTSLPTPVQQRLQADIEAIRRFLHWQGGEVPRPQPVTTAARGHQRCFFAALPNIMIALARQVPMLLIMDDLHGADAFSVTLFGNLVSAMTTTAADTPLFLVGTYFPPLSDASFRQALAHYQQQPDCYDITLLGFDHHESHAFLQELGIEHPAPQLVAALHATTQGNPWFLQEIVQALQHRTAFTQRDGCVVTTIAPDAVQLSTQLTSALLAPLAEMSQNAQGVLTEAAFLGRHFTVERLCTISSASTEEVFAGIEEGIKQGVLIDHRTHCQFLQPLLKHVLYNALPLPRRQRLHRDIAHRLEQLSTHQQEAWLPDLAHHFTQTSLPASASKAIAYARQAGDLAFTRGLWEHAARQYEAALDAMRTTDIATPQEEASLHYQAGLAHFRAYAIARSLAHFDKASQAYRAACDVSGLARVLLAKTQTALTLPLSRQQLHEIAEQLGSLLETLGTKDQLLSGYMAALLAECYVTLQHTDQAMLMVSQAMEIGKKFAAPTLLAAGHLTLALVYSQQNDHQDIHDRWQESLSYARRSQDGWLQSHIVMHQMQDFLRMGHFDMAQHTALQAQELTASTPDRTGYLAAVSTCAITALARGNYAVVEEIAATAVHLTWCASSTCDWLRAVTTLTYAHALRGQWDAAETMLSLLQQSAQGCLHGTLQLQSSLHAFRLWLHAHADIPETLPPQSIQLSPDPLACDPYQLGSLCAIVEYAQQTAPHLLPAPLYEILVLAVQRGTLFTSASGWLCLIPRVLGVAAFLLGQHSTAATHFDTAIRIATRAHTEPELGRTYLDYARLLVAQSTASSLRQAVAYLQQAQGIFHLYGMQPFAQQAATLLSTALQTVSLSQHVLLPKPPALPPYAQTLVPRLTGTHLSFLG